MAGDRVLQWTAGHEPEARRPYAREIRGDRDRPDRWPRLIKMFPSRAIDRIGIHLMLTLSWIVNRLKVGQAVVDHFHNLYWSTRWNTWSNTFFLGASCCKSPLDLWIYQEMIHELKPDVIVECGTFLGGTGFFLAVMCELVAHGTVVTIDLNVHELVKERGRPEHPRLRYLTGSSTSAAIMQEVKRVIGDHRKVMVILDSNHHKEHVLQEMRLYSELIPKGGYLIVEDTCLNGHPIKPDFGPGPMEAVEEFLQENQDFVIDKSREKFHMTFNRNGFLKRVGRTVAKTETQPPVEVGVGAEAEGCGAPILG